jgi:hypothetical protein
VTSESDNEFIQLIRTVSGPDPLTTEGVDAMRRLGTRLAIEPEFSGPPRAVLSGSGAHGFNTDFVANRMIQIVKDTGDARKALAWFRKVSKATGAAGRAIKALYGVNCEASIALSEAVTLVPFSDVPASPTRDWIAAEHERANQQRGLHGFMPPPTAALCHEGYVPNIFSSATTDFSNRPNITWFNTLDDAALLLVLAPGTIPREAARWMDFDDPDIFLLSHFGVMRHSSEWAFETQRFISPPPVISTSIENLLPAYSKLAQDNKDRITLALQRLLRSRSQLHPGNRAIDLAIALEVLFMRTERDEHSYKISNRAARLLHENRDRQLPVFNQIRRLYEVRSSMVHSGKTSGEVSIDGSKISVHELVKSVETICSEVIRKFLTLGGVPADDGWRDIEFSS